MRDRVTGSQLEARVAVNTEAVARELRDALVSTQEELIAVLNKKAYKSDVQRALAKKADEGACGARLWITPAPPRSHTHAHLAEEMRQALESKADVNDVREALALKADVSAMGALASGRGDSGPASGMNGSVAPADVISAVRESREAAVTARRATEEAREAGGGVREVREELAQLSRALEAKSDSKEMCRLLDTKAGALWPHPVTRTSSPVSPPLPPALAYATKNVLLCASGSPPSSASAIASSSASTLPMPQPSAQHVPSPSAAAPAHVTLPLAS